MKTHPLSILVLDIGFLSAIDRTRKQATNGRFGLDYLAVLRRISDRFPYDRALAFYGSRSPDDHFGYGSRYPLEALLKPEGVRFYKSRADQYGEIGTDDLLARTTLRVVREEGARQVTLVTGDGDFVPLVHQLKALGPKVNLVGANYPSVKLRCGRQTLPHFTSKLLAQTCDETMTLNEHMLHPTSSRRTSLDHLRHQNGGRRR